MSLILYDVKIIERRIIVAYHWVVKVVVWHQNKDIEVCLHPCVMIEFLMFDVYDFDNVTFLCQCMFVNIDVDACQVECIICKFCVHSTHRGLYYIMAIFQKMASTWKGSVNFMHEWLLSDLEASVYWWQAHYWFGDEESSKLTLMSNDKCQLT